MNTRTQTHIAYGFITALAMIIVGAVFQVAKLSTKPGIQYIPFAVMLVGLILNAQAYSKANNADITFGQAFGSSFKATAIIAIVFVAWSFIALMIWPEIYDQAIEKVQLDLEKKHMSEEQIDATLGMTKKFFKPFMAAGALFGTLFFGAIFSLIAAAIAKKNPRQTQFVAQ
jgi:energy-coupling factor transporter transmembrane protein EcfT